jgi:TolB-like protein
MAVSQEAGLTGAINELADRLAFANVGYVRSVSGDTVYIDLGQDSGICEGMRFEVVRLGEPIVSEGVIIGHQEEIIGEIAITRVREQMSLASITKKTKEIGEGDKVYQLTKQIERIAITEFPYGERFNNLSKDIEDRLYTAMIQRGMQIVERERLTEILAEQAMEWTGLFDLSSAAELGKLLGVEGVLIGSITDQGETLAIRARLVDVETAQAITAAASSINKTPAIITALSSGIRSKPSVVWRGEQADQLPEGCFVFSDEFHVQPDERWDITNGKWTIINGRFTALERGTGKWYQTTVDVGNLRNYTIEVDVYLGICCAYRCDQSCYARIVLREFLSGNDPQGVYFELRGVGHKLNQTNLYTSTFGVDVRGAEADSPIHVKVEVQGALYTAYLNGERISEFFDPMYQGDVSAEVGLGIYNGGNKEPSDRTTFINFRIEEIP